MGNMQRMVMIPRNLKMDQIQSLTENCKATMEREREKSKSEDKRWCKIIIKPEKLYLTEYKLTDIETDDIVCRIKQRTKQKYKNNGNVELVHKKYLGKYPEQSSVRDEF